MDTDVSNAHDSDSGGRMKVSYAVIFIAVASGCSSMQKDRLPAAANSLNWAGGAECRIEDNRESIAKGDAQSEFFGVSLVKDGTSVKAWNALIGIAPEGPQYQWGEMLANLSMLADELKCDRLTVVHGRSDRKSSKPYRPSKDGKLFWGTDTCYVIDYTRLIARGEPAEHYYAIHPFNHNGGSVVATYGTEEFSSASWAFRRMIDDLGRYDESCDRIKVFYPESLQDYLRN